MLTNQEGLTLVEVTIAVFLFSIFIVTFISGQGANIIDSIQFKRDLILKDLAEAKLNEVILDPPEFKESLTSAGVESKDFEEFPGYRYNLEFKKIHIPDYTKLKGNDEDAETDSQKAALEKQVFKQMKDNMEKMVWQVSLTVIHKETEASYEVSTWVYNHNAALQIKGL